MAASAIEPNAPLSEEACLDEVMRLRFAGKPCPACESTRGFVQARKHRAFSCLDCGLKVYPCEGTVFADPRMRLVDWFRAIRLAAQDRKLSPRKVRRLLGVGAETADTLTDGIEILADDAASGRAETDWFDAVSSFVRDKEGEAQDAAEAAAPPEADVGETTWQTFRSYLRRPSFGQWNVIGLVGVAVFAALGIGIGSMLGSHDQPVETESEESEQAAVILTLASDRPVILVTADVAEQLYDVSDVDAPAEAAPAPEIRLMPSGGASSEKAVAEASPLSRPAIKLSPIAGRSLLQGDLAAVKNGNRPELAAYKSLAIELDATGPRNPDEILVFGPIKVRRHLVEKIVRAARATSMDPVLLMAIADKESSFQTEVQAQTSSASGLFQFIEKTWFGVVREFGPRYGLDAEARLLSAGDLAPPERVRILALRNDAFLSAVLAAEMLKRDSDRIGRRIGRQLTGGEIYLVHFLGPDGAERLLERVKNAPTASAAELLPKPADANKSIFYAKNSDDGTTKGLSVAEVHGKFEVMMSTRIERYRAVAKPAAAKPASTTSAIAKPAAKAAPPASR